MADNKMDAIFAAMCGDGAELNAEELSSVSGGVIDSSAKEKLIAGIKLAKSTGVSLSEVLAQLPTYYNLMHSAFPNVTQKEAEKFIKDNWSKY